MIILISITKPSLLSSKQRETLQTYKDMNEFKMPYQLRTNLAKYETGDVLPDSHSILNI